MSKEKLYGSLMIFERKDFLDPKILKVYDLLSKGKEEEAFEIAFSDSDFSDMIGNVVLSSAGEKTIDGFEYICPWTSKYKFESLYEYSLPCHFAILFHKNATIDFDERGCVSKYIINSRLAKENLTTGKEFFLKKHKEMEEQLESLEEQEQEKELEAMGGKDSYSIRRTQELKKQLDEFNEMYSIIERTLDGISDYAIIEGYF